jgi:hypothetical protein
MAFETRAVQSEVRHFPSPLESKAVFSYVCQNKRTLNFLLSMHLFRRSRLISHVSNSVFGHIRNTYSSFLRYSILCIFSHSPYQLTNAFNITQIIKYSSWYVSAPTYFDNCVPSSGSLLNQRHRGPPRQDNSG